MRMRNILNMRFYFNERKLCSLEHCIKFEQKKHLSLSLQEQAY